MANSAQTVNYQSMKHLFIGAIAGALLCAPALAQPQNNADQNNFGAQGGAVFELPSSVQSVVSIDALNTLIIAQNDEQTGETQYTTAKIQHVYSGGIARLFGGTSIPTAQFATPGLLNGGGNNNQNNNGGFGGNNRNGVTNFGGNGVGNNQNGAFGGNGFGGNGFGNAILGGNGFNTNNRNTIVNARLRAR